MEEVVRIRAILHETLSDIEPVEFRTQLDSVIADAALTPAVLTVRTASALSELESREAARRRGVGVQLSFEGLKLTRRLARDNPWSVTDAPDNHHIELLVAQTLVSRGFYYLADTGVSDRAIEIARRFARNMTNDLQPETQPTEPSLEFDVVALAVEAGADFALSTLTPVISERARRIATDLEAQPLPAPETAIPRVAADIDRLVLTGEHSD
jgi:hypothetical protein